MKVFVLYDKSGIHSGRALGKDAIVRFRGKAFVQRGRLKRLEQLHKRGKRFDYIVNVGWYKNFDPRGAVVLNAPESISLSSNKKNARIKFKSKSVPAPRLWTNVSDIKKVNLPIIARTTHHTQGKGLWFCQTMAELKSASRGGATHYLKFIPNTREFRVHVMAPEVNLSKVEAEDYRVIKVSEKLPKKGANRADVVKNHDNGWFFGYPADKRDPALPRVREAARKAIKVFGMHWGAVDIMISRDTGEPYVLEINSTPRLTDDQANTLEKYSEGLMVLLNLKERPSNKKKYEVPLKKTVKIMSASSKLKKFLRRGKV